MKYRTRIYYTDEQKTLMWDRWQKGESLQGDHSISLDPKHSFSSDGKLVCIDSAYEIKI